MACNRGFDTPRRSRLTDKNTADAHMAVASSAVGVETGWSTIQSPQPAVAGSLLLRTARGAVVRFGLEGHRFPIATLPEARARLSLDGSQHHPRLTPASFEPRSTSSSLPAVELRKFRMRRRGRRNESVGEAMAWATFRNRS